MVVDSNSTTVSQLEEKLENEDIHCSLFVSSFPLKIPVIMPMLKGVLQYSSPKFDTCIGFTEQIMLYSLPSSGITNVTHLNIALAANPDLIVCFRCAQFLLSTDKRCDLRNTERIAINI